MILKVLFVDDDEKIRTDLVKIFDNQVLAGHTLITSSASTFEEGLDFVQNNDYDFIVLDLYKGDPKEGNEKLGFNILNKIRSTAFIPVIFYSGLTKDLEGLKSEVVGIVNKGDGIDGLTLEMERIISSQIALIKCQVYSHIKEALREYFWDTVHSENHVFVQGKGDISLGYLLLRRIANSLSKENIKLILGDTNIKADKAHPMEFYIYPTSKGEYEAGEILLKDETYHIILTPTCDFVEDKESKRERRVGKVLMTVASLLSETESYKNYKQSNSKENKEKLYRIIQTRKGDQFFFLPGTPFMENLVIDFQNKKMIEYTDLKLYKRLAKLDDPYAQSMISSFIRFYNRVGFPDIDADYVIDNL